jgi:hypothetical protein
MDALQTHVGRHEKTPLTPLTLREAHSFLGFRRTLVSVDRWTDIAAAAGEVPPAAAVCWIAAHLRRRGAEPGHARKGGQKRKK